MTLHISFGILILVLIVLRFFWRITIRLRRKARFLPGSV
jgi:cytochrome b561